MFTLSIFMNYRDKNRDITNMNNTNNSRNNNDCFFCIVLWPLFSMLGLCLVCWGFVQYAIAESLPCMLGLCLVLLCGPTPEYTPSPPGPSAGGPGPHGGGGGGGPRCKQKLELSLHMYIYPVGDLFGRLAVKYISIVDSCITACPWIVHQISPAVFKMIFW